MKLLRIVPGKHEDGSDAIACHGTKVLLPDGMEVPGIRKLTLVAEVGCVWTATMECVVHGPEITALGDTSAVFAKQRSRLHEWLARLLGKVP